MVDAFKPENGQRGTDYASDFSRKAMEEAVAKGEPGRKAPPPAAFGVIDPKDQEWVKSKMTDQPNGVATQPIAIMMMRRAGTMAQGPRSVSNEIAYTSAHRLVKSARRDSCGVV